MISCDNIEALNFRKRPSIAIDSSSSIQDPSFTDSIDNFILESFRIQEL